MEMDKNGWFVYKKCVYVNKRQRNCIQLIYYVERFLILVYIGGYDSKNTKSLTTFEF